jgi:hypothetical protein
MNRLLLLLAIVATAVACDPSVVEASDPRALQLTYQSWTKICINRADGNSDCFTS